MFVKITLSGGLKITLLIEVPHSFMYRLNMDPEIIRSGALVITKFTRILDTSMFKFHVPLHGSFIEKYFITVNAPGPGVRVFLVQDEADFC